MSGVAALRHLLSHHTPLTAVVPAVNIVSGVIPQKSPIPAISLMKVSSTERLTVAMVGARFNSERVQVTVLARTYAQRDDIITLVRDACPLSRGTINGVDVDSVLPAGEGPDDDDTQLTIFEGSIDFIVRWRK
jgi:hypothetical protein